MGKDTKNYAKMWNTLMKTGIKQRFGQIRKEFFMKLATDGPKSFNETDLETIITNSNTLKDDARIQDIIKSVILPGDEFKYYEYHTSDELFFVDYFANKNRILPVGILNEGNNKDVIKPETIDAFCCSEPVTVQVPKEGSETESGEVNTEPVYITKHLIMVGENPGITPDNYPAIIKHELTHACTMELINKFNHKSEDLMTPSLRWDISEQDSWESDLTELIEFINAGTLESEMFKEFIAEFMMYESDGQIKVQNPIPESRVPKASKPDAKPKVTFTTLTPFDRFQDNIESFPSNYRDWFQKFLNQIRDFYADYDAFLDSTK